MNTKRRELIDVPARSEIAVLNEVHQACWQVLAPLTFEQRTRVLGDLCAQHRRVSGLPG